MDYSPKTINSMDKALLKVYASRYSDDPVSIVGNQEGLIRLRNLLNDAIDQPGNYTCKTFSQGESALFSLHCRHISNDEVEVLWDNFPAQEDEFSEMSNEELFLIEEFCRD